jgi:hypothetical protein
VIKIAISQASSPLSVASGESRKLRNLSFLRLDRVDNLLKAHS